MMNRKLFFYISIAVLITLALSVGSQALSAPAQASAFTGYYNMIGYEGIGTLGSTLQPNGPTPPVGDYTTTHCRYIDVTDTLVGQYYLRYPLHLANGANVSQIDFFVADFNSTGVLWMYLRSRPWNSRESGDLLGLTLTDNTFDGDRTVSITGLDVNIDNHTTEYWIDVSPTNGANPGQLCVYGIQVTFVADGAFLPLIVK